MTRDVAQDTLALAQLAELSQRLLTLTETTERLATGVMNHTLFAGTITIPVEGWYGFSWGATCGSVEVTNTSEANQLKVTSSPPGNDTTQGPGTHYVEPGTFRLLNMDSRSITIYGTAGDRVGVQAFTTGGIAGQGPAV